MASYYRQLQNRGVIRVAVAYLAGSWLIVQVLDVLTSILNLPPEFARYVLFVVAVGFPVALALSWRYDLTSQGVTVTGDNQVSAGRSAGARRIDVAIIVTLSAAVVLLIADRYVFRAGGPSDKNAIPVVNDVTRLTQSQLFFPPVSSQYPMVSDGTKLYFSQWTINGLGLAQIPISGGVHVETENPIEGPDSQVRVTDISPDNSDLVLMSFDPIKNEGAIWLWPTTGAPPRKRASGADAVFSKDGTSTIYSPDRISIVVADADFSNPREIGKAPGPTHWIRMSPEGDKIRFVLLGWTNRIFEMPVSGGEARPLLPDWEDIDHCCGTWTDDGRYYVFQAHRNGRTQLWAIREDGDEAEPVQITSGPLDFRRPLLADNGRSIYAIGWQLRGELVKFDLDTQRFLPIPGLESLSAEWAAFSTDGTRVAYVSHPDGTLWRSNTDGSRKVQLTTTSMKTIQPQWSPDGETIAFTGIAGNEPFRVYLVSSDGGVPVVADPDNRPSIGASWSPDGGSLAYNVWGVDLIQVLDVESGEATGLEGSDGMFAPKWSPDGNSLAVQTGPGLALFDLSTGSVESLPHIEDLEDYFWSDDGSSLYVAESGLAGRGRAYLRLDIATGAVTQIARPGELQSSWGVINLWIGAAPDGMPMLLRDLGIHHIYKLDWLPEELSQ